MESTLYPPSFSPDTYFKVTSEVNADVSADSEVEDKEIADGKMKEAVHLSNSVNSVAGYKQSRPSSCET